MTRTFHVSVIVTLKAGVLDPQGRAIEGALQGLGFGAVSDMRQGKHFAFTLRAPSMEDAQVLVSKMCSQLLVNGVVEDSHIQSIEEM